MENQNDAAKVRFFPPGIPLLAIVVGSIFHWLWPLPGYWELSAPARYYIGGGIAIGSILVLGLWSVALFRKGGQSENPWKPTPNIEVRGPFRFTRNPMYLQMVLVCVGVSIAFWNMWILVLTPLVVWALTYCAIEPEETYLEEKFGQTYTAYKESVRRWI